jgi:N-ethylmaleimide reductase
MDNKASILFTPFELGGRTLKNRLVMAPLTRNRAIHGTDVPQELNAQYYEQRASAGLIISEATQISPTAKGYAWTPGIYSPEQVNGWRLVTAAVHAKDGTIYAQLWHVGLVSHPSLQPGGALPVAPSAVLPKGQKTFVESGTFTELVTPRALTLEEIPLIVEDYRKAAKNAIDAGFDGVEVHAANGYLIQQFLSDGTNKRTDKYGGSITNRLRFALEVMEAVTAEIGAHRTGIRISPVGVMNGITETSPNDVYFPLVRELSRLTLAYIHVIEGQTQGPRDLKGFDFYALRKEFQGAWMVNNNYTRELAIDAIASGYADLVAFGRPFIANPDLVKRFELNALLNEFDRSTFYGGTEKGYTDYPTLS